jgi:hypothetical protein
MTIKRIQRHHRARPTPIKDVLKLLGIENQVAAYDLEIPISVWSGIANNWVTPKDPERRKAISTYLGVEESLLWPELETEAAQKPITSRPAYPKSPLTSTNQGVE